MRIVDTAVAALGAIIKSFTLFLIWFPVTQAAEGDRTLPCTSENSAKPMPKVWFKKYVTGLKAPVDIKGAGDGRGRLYVAEQQGTIRIIRKGALAPGFMLDIRDRVVQKGEMGLLSLAFHPEFKRNGRFYVHYNSAEGAERRRCKSGVSRCSIVSEFRVMRKRVVRQSERVLLNITQPYGNHNGGQLAFGPDNYLYIGLGDGGSGGDPDNNGQNLRTLLGSILRIDVDQSSGPLNYSIPKDNPQWDGVAGARREIWAYGLRNPWRFSFDPLKGFLYAGDVGQNMVEEIDIIQKGKNYGWNPVEGDRCYLSDCKLEDYTPPLLAVDQEKTGWSAITGGLVYRGSNIPELCGAYIYGDYMDGEVRGLYYDEDRGVVQDQLLGEVSNVSSFGYDDDYEVYALNHWRGIVYKLTQK